MDISMTAAPAADQAATAAAGAGASESQAINELATALAKAQGAFSNPEKDRRNPHFGNCYATLGAVIEATRKALAENGLSLTQTVGGRPPSLRSRLLHSSGQWLASEVPLYTAGKGSQVFGSELTYMRRYAVCALLNIAPAEGDDDGNAAQAAAGAEARARQAREGGPRSGNSGEAPPRHAGGTPARPLSHGQPAAAPAKADAAPRQAQGASRRRKDEPSPPSVWGILRPGKAGITASDGTAWLNWWTGVAGKAAAEGKRDWLRTLYELNTVAWDEIALGSPEASAVVAKAAEAVSGALGD